MDRDQIRKRSTYVRSTQIARTR